MTPKKLPEQAYLRQCLDYDAATGILTWKERPRSHFQTAPHWINWNKRHAGKRAGCPNKAGRRAIGLDAGKYYAYRLIWKMETGEDPPADIDHRHRDKGDDRISELRPATRAENLSNKMGKPGRGLPKGVSIFRKTQYRAQIVRHGVNYHLGYFATPEEAAAAYREAATRLHGEFARFE